MILRAIDPEKDVDGFNLYNVGGVVIGDTVFLPCTPFGVLRLLEHENIVLEGQNVVVVGASDIVGKPMALMLMQRDATVCICRAKTRVSRNSRYWRIFWCRRRSAKSNSGANGKDRCGGY